MFINLLQPSKSKPQNTEKEEMDGMCIDGERMMKMCIYGSALGDKSPAAMEVCDGDNENERSLGELF